jgi:colanic acid/amylovoran biosynthesis glycosyltransferase
VVVALNSRLLVLTASYPFTVAAEQTFLEPEIQHYRGRFEQIVLVPQLAQGNQVSVPDGIQVDTSLADGLQSMGRLSLFVRGLFSWRFYRELLIYPRLLLAPLRILRMALTCGRVEYMAGWFKRQLPATVEPVPTVIYSFWLDASVLAAGIFRERGGRATIVARAHGWDLYAQRHSPAHIPLQLETIALANHVAPDSFAGTTYLQQKYPKYADKIRSALLGTDDPGFRTAASTDGVVRIVSCSFLVEVKRVNLLVVGIAALAGFHKGLSIEWTHFGGGPLLDDIRALCESLLPSQVQWRLQGNVDTRFIYDWYRAHPVDVFINVSSSEGTPVSIMEAISCSIPVIATSVGGNKEIVNDSLGQLISADPKPEEIALAIESVCFDEHRLEKLKRGSYEQWSKNYSAEKNYQTFARLLWAGF